MGEYYSKWNGFEIESKRHLMDLLIEPSFHPAICIQFREMEDGRYWAFYNFQPTWKVLAETLKAYIHEQKMDPSIKPSAAFDIAASVGVLKSLAPVSCYLLEEEERRCVEELYTNELPSTDEHHSGLDGHSYILRIYKNDIVKCYTTWCVTPLSWEALRDLIRGVVNRLDLNYDNYGAYISKYI